MGPAGLCQRTGWYSVFNILPFYPFSDFLAEFFTFKLSTTVAMLMAFWQIAGMICGVQQAISHPFLERKAVAFGYIAAIDR